MTKRRLLATAFFVWAVSAHVTHVWLGHFQNLEPPHDYKLSITTPYQGASPDLQDFERDYTRVREAIGDQVEEGRLLAFVQAELRSLYWQFELRDIPAMKPSVMGTVESHLQGQLPSELIHEAVFRALARASRQVTYKAQGCPYQNQLEPAGIGALIAAHPRGVELVSLLPDHPAINAGLEPGDVVIAVSGRSIIGCDVKDAVRALRGQSGEEVRVRVQRGRGLLLRTFDLTLERAHLNTTQSIAVNYEGDEARIEVLWFDGSTAHQIEAATAQAKARGCSKLVFDLTHAREGHINSAAECASIFLPSNTLVAQLESPRHSYEVRVGTEQPQEGLKLEAKVGPGTRGPGEVLAFALRKADARITGDRTPGMGLVSRSYRCATGDILELPDYQVIVDGYTLQGHGLRPDLPTLSELLSK